MNAAGAPGGAGDRAAGGASWRRALLIWGGLALAALVVAALCPLIGSTPIDLARALGLKGAAAGGGAANLDAQILFGIRLPRVLFGLLAGGALAMSGAVFQALLRNDLATPYTLGVSGGATVGALLALRWAPGVAGGAITPLAAFATAALAVALIYALASLRGPGAPPATLLLAGVTLNLLFGSIILFIQYLSDPYQTYTLLRWLMGGLDISGYGAALALGGATAAGGAALLALARSLNLISFGDQTAAHLGVAVERTRLIALAAASLMTAIVVSFAGPIGFVGLIIPHALRRLFGADHRVLLPACALAGGAFLVVCDTGARTVFAPTELPVGVVTSFLGAPFFLYILFRRRG